MEAIEARRQRLGITLQALADRSGVAIATLRRIRRGGFAFRRQVLALRMALRSLERDARAADTMFGGRE